MTSGHRVTVRVTMDEGFHVHVCPHGAAPCTSHTRLHEACSSRSQRGGAHANGGRVACMQQPLCSPAEEEAVMLTRTYPFSPLVHEVDEDGKRGSQPGSRSVQSQVHS